MVNTNKMNFKTATILLLAVLLTFSSIAFPATGTYSSSLNEGSTITFSGENDGIYISENGAVAVFVGGVLVGYIFSVVVDGVVISASGSSSSEWVARAIKKVVGKKATSKVQLTKAGGGSGAGGGGGGGVR